MAEELSGRMSEIVSEKYVHHQRTMGRLRTLSDSSAASESEGKQEPVPRAEYQLNASENDARHEESGRDKTYESFRRVPKK